jgi:phosphatidylglycerophosphate synthase
MADQHAVTGEDTQRRPLKSRGTGWASLLTRALLKTPITPNQVSIIGIGFAFMGAWAMLNAPTNPWLWLLGALGIQLRLLANMMDGLVAVEGQRGSPTGPLFNELPDRLQDGVLLVAAGYAAGVPWLGWLATALAISTAYVRATGAYLGFGQDYSGPMAKPHRMAALTIGALGSLGLALAGQDFPLMKWILALIALGTAITIVRRTLRIARQLRDAAA